MFQDDFCHQLYLVCINLATAGQKAVNGEVLGAVEQDGIGSFAISPGASDLLVIGIDGIADIVVENETDVFLVTTNAKGGGSDNHLCLILPEALIHRFSIFNLH